MYLLLKSFFCCCFFFSSQMLRWRVKRCAGAGSVGRRDKLGPEGRHRGVERHDGTLADTIVTDYD